MINHSKILLDIAIDDIESAISLYENKKFRNSYYLFQQASEKAIKSIGLFTGIVTLKKIEKDIKHRHLEVFRKLFVKQIPDFKNHFKMMEYLPNVKKHELYTSANIKETHKSLIENVKLIDSLVNYDMINLPINILDNLLNILYNIKDVKLKMPENVNEILSTILYKVTDYIGQFNSPQAIETKKLLLGIYNDKKKSNKFFSILFDKLLPIIIKHNFSIMTFYFCGIITRDNNCIRYPKDDSNPLEIYNYQLPIIKKQYEFMMLLRDALNNFKQLDFDFELIADDFISLDNQ